MEKTVQLPRSSGIHVHSNSPSVTSLPRVTVRSSPTPLARSRAVSSPSLPAAAKSPPPQLRTSESSIAALASPSSSLSSSAVGPRPPTAAGSKALQSSASLGAASASPTIASLGLRAPLSPPRPATQSSARRPPSSRGFGGGANSSSPSPVAEKLDKNNRYDPQTVLWLCEYFLEMDVDQNGSVDADELRAALSKRPTYRTGEKRYYSDTLFFSLTNRSSSELTLTDIWPIVFPLANERDFKVISRLAKSVIDKARDMSAKNAEKPVDTGAKEITAEALEEIQAMFELFDTDGDSLLSFEEFRAASARTGHVTPDLLQKMFDDMDINKDSKVDLEEFTAYMKRNYVEPSILQTPLVFVEGFQYQEPVPD